MDAVPHKRKASATSEDDTHAGTDGSSTHAGMDAGTAPGLVNLLGTGADPGTESESESDDTGTVMTSPSAPSIEIMDNDYLDAIDAFGGVLIEYDGYPEARLNKIELAYWQSQQMDADVDNEHDNEGSDNEGYTTDDDNVFTSATAVE
jgi:hypothetical protein